MSGLVTTTIEVPMSVLERIGQLTDEITANSHDADKRAHAITALNYAVDPLLAAVRSARSSGKYPVNPHAAAVHTALSTWRGDDLRRDRAWNTALAFIADHMPTTPETLTKVMHDAAERDLVSRIPGVGQRVFERLQSVFNFEGQYDNNNAGASPGRFNKFMQDYYGDQ